MYRSKDKSNDRLSSNDRISMRDMENMAIDKSSKNNNHGQNIDRLLFERDNVFGMNSRDDGQDKGDFGEITGGEYEDNTLDRGLPMRSQYVIKKPMYDQNEHLDFDLYNNDKKPSKLNIKNSDLMNDNMPGFAEISISMTKISTQINPMGICSEGIDKLNNNLFYYLFDVMINKNYIVNGIGMYNLFGGLYLVADGTTEFEIKKFFDFPNKESMFKGLSKINGVLKNIEHMINIKNFMLVGDDVPYNPKCSDSIKDFCMLIRANIDNPESETRQINHIINKIMGEEIKTPVHADNIFNLQLMFISIATIHPVWNVAFDDITNNMFNALDHRRKEYYLHSVGRNFGYFEDNQNQILEITCNGNKLVMGILLSKEEFGAEIDDMKLHFYISNIKDSVIDEVKIPMFKQNLKMRYNATLKNMGMHSLFINTTSQNLFPEGVSLQDVTQNVKITIDNKCASKNSNGNKNSYVSSRKFIANKPFIYYFRLPQTNTFLFFGTYK
jgi:serine protease inhibitor